MTSAIRVAIVDYGAGNLVSIRNALQLLGAQVHVATTADDLAGADAILVPGVGASQPAMDRLRRQGLVDPIIERVRGGTWYLGICLGLQLLFERSHEDGAVMLGLLRGDVERIADAPSLPHIGWNRLERRRPHPVLEGLPDGTPAYFVHSYVPVPADPSVVVAETEHGSRFASLVASDHIVGFQFHPERSGDDGLRMLANTLALVGGRVHDPFQAGQARGAA
ncbi:MAG TPA: imidazole glycerol phosphate synthase subunit HisH [Candidatus Deferrimicrobium sp.]|nr:imidazole glycerol phosphate synthase subunit HisH [Candidatus Deferrimicrobium sp.]